MIKNTTPTHNHLLKKFNTGNIDGYEFIFKSFYNKLCYFADSIVNNEAMSQDIVQDVFIRLWERENNFETYDNLSAFLYVSVRNSCFNHLRQQKSSRVDTQEINNLVESDNSTIEDILSAEVISVISGAIDTLPSECKKIMQLIMQGYSMIEISIILNLASSTVRAQKARAIQLLKSKVSEKMFILILIFIK